MADAERLDAKSDDREYLEGPEVWTAIFGVFLGKNVVENAKEAEEPADMDGCRARGNDGGGICK